MIDGKGRSEPYDRRIVLHPRRRLDDNQRYETDHLSYQRQLSALDDGDKGNMVAYAK